MLVLVEVQREIELVPGLMAAPIAFEGVAVCVIAAVQVVHSFVVK